ncbi:MAG: metallophosphoesterase [Candidatus Woesearchaeota archaeon]|nr:MAG: metallophosphoesterase [Candidatus Woesearchaeota archaeon]
MKKLLFALFLFVFASILYLIHYYSLFRLFGFFSITLSLWLVALLLSLFYPVAALIDRLFHSLPTRWLYFLASSWLGIIFFLFTCTIFLEFINVGIPLFGKEKVGWAVLAGLAGVTAYALFAGSKLIVKKVTIPHFGKKLSVVQLSDIHVGTIHSRKFLEKVVAKTNALRPDVVVVTGDLVDGSGKLTDESFAALHDLTMPVYVVLGNHEYYDGIDNVLKRLAKYNLRVLQDEVVFFKGVQLIGLTYYDSEKKAREVIAQIPFDAKKPSIVLQHVPIGQEIAKKRGMRLQLSGHTHAGQIFPFSLLVKAKFPQYKGLYRFGGFSLYVSSGTGTWGPPMRLGSRSEITFLELS